MADRASFTGRRGPRGPSRAGPRGSGRGGGAGGGFSDRGPGGTGAGRGSKSDDAPFDPTVEKPKRENILDLNKYLDKELRVKFNGGREVKGTLKGFDQLMNLVLDDVVESMIDANGDAHERNLGLLVARGTTLMLIAPTESEQVVKNPFYDE